MLPVPGAGTGGGGMLVVETIARIRREFFVKGRSIKEIVRDLKVSRNTVRKVLRSGETSFSYEREFSRCRGWGAGGTTSTGFMAGFR
jgi:hypothetical protein